jgi:nucleotide-binding universal stress UspA family protein
MPVLSRILAPVEFSPRDKGAAKYVEALAGHFHSEIVLLHVVATPQGAYSPPEALTYSTAGDLVEQLVVQRTADLNAYLVDEWKGLDVRRVVLRGDPARQISALAAGEHCDLIVMATHGYGPFRRFLLGSVTAKVLHDARCPVWTGPHMETPPPRETIHFRRILCALDLAPHSREVLAWGAGFAREFGAELAVAHAVPMSTAKMGGMYFDPDWCKDVKQRARDTIAGMQAEIASRGEAFVEVGEPPVVVSDVARRVNADLIVIGRGAPGLMGRLRANSYAILRDAPCAVVGV